MSEYQIYHNPRCSKSRETLELLKANGIEPKIREYLKQPLSEGELLQLLANLDCEPQLLVRTKDELYKAQSFAIDCPETIAKLLASHPELMERPVVVKGKQAVLGRPPENIKALL